MDSTLVKLYKNPKNIFHPSDLSIIWGERNADNLKAKIYYYVKNKALARLWRGIYAKTDDYDPKELATSFYSPSYISFETALAKHGMIFQYYESIFVAAPWNKEIVAAGHKFRFRRIKKSLLYNPAGLVRQKNYHEASPERAFLDTLYLLQDYYFDNLRGLDWEKVFTLVPIYGNKQLIKRVKKYYKLYAEQRET
jgi:hypothetical protein